MPLNEEFTLTATELEARINVALAPYLEQINDMAREITTLKQEINTLK